jgi:hypothetical protein
MLCERVVLEGGGTDTPPRQVRAPELRNPVPPGSPCTTAFSAGSQARPVPQRHLRVQQLLDHGSRLRRDARARERDVTQRRTRACSGPSPPWLRLPPYAAQPPSSTPAELPARTPPHAPPRTHPVHVVVCVARDEHVQLVVIAGLGPRDGVRARATLLQAALACPHTPAGTAGRRQWRAWPTLTLGCLLGDTPAWRCDTWACSLFRGGRAPRMAIFVLVSFSMRFCVLPRGPMIRPMKL